MIDFDTAKTSHRIFVQMIGLIVEGLAISTSFAEQAGDDTRCRLGRWLAAVGLEIRSLPSVGARSMKSVCNSHGPGERLASCHLLVPSRANDRIVLNNEVNQFAL